MIDQLEEWRPGRRRRRMAAFTGITGIGMSDGFATGDMTVVTRYAPPLDNIVIHPRRRQWRPVTWKPVVTALALLATADMIRRFTARRLAVMAGDTIVVERTVIGRGVAPVVAAMAGSAILRCSQVAGRAAAGAALVVTDFTASGIDMGVIEIGIADRQPVTETVVTSGAILAGRQMIRWLTGSRATRAMTARTALLSRGGMFRCGIAPAEIIADGSRRGQQGGN